MSMTEEQKKQAKKMLDENASKTTMQDVEKILEKQKKIEKIFSGGILEQYFYKVKQLINMVKDYASGEYRKVPWTTIAAIVGALIYVLSPIDIIPDFIPVIGYVDDAFVIAVTLKALESDINNYIDWKNNK